jgi:hypothetical protein
MKTKHFYIFESIRLYLLVFYLQCEQKQYHHKLIVQQVIQPFDHHARQMLVVVPINIELLFSFYLKLS